MEYLIDVRTPEEFFDDHYDGAVNHELLLFEDELLPEYSKDADIYLYCRSGKRAERARKIMLDAGFKNVVNLGGYNPELDKEEE
ncbi:MAG: rhodanese-like domain-containing protein [Candidatus Pacebacteria bacterium]|nr:rhodanese-like domain-containing protein [Candidatus Paceibacterota bacterium]